MTFGSLRHFSSNKSRWIAGITIVSILAVVGLTLAQGWDLSPKERLVSLRFLLLLFLAIASFLPPHRLFPDRNEPLLRLLNYDLKKLAAYLIWHERLVLLAFWLIPLSLAWGNIELWTSDYLWQLSISFLLSLVPATMYLFALIDYLSVGVESQQWQEGLAGTKWRERAEETGSAVSAGSIPTLSATLRLMVGSWAVLIAVAYLGGKLQVNLDLLVFPIFLIGLGLRFRQKSGHLHQLYYQAHGFYRDFILGGRSTHEERDPITYEQIYWIPHRFRPSAWMLLRQLERRFPFGRLFIIGHLVLWLLWYLNLSPWILWGYLTLFTVFQIASTVFTGNQQIAPPGRLLRLHSTGHWFMARIFVQLRWIAPYTISLSLIALLSSGFTVYNMMRWVLFFAMGIIVLAALITQLNEGRTKRQYQ
jgi:hypothetical protein